MRIEMNSCMLADVNDKENSIAACEKVFKKYTSDKVETIVLNKRFSSLDETVSEHIKQRDLSMSLLRNSNVDLSEYKILKGTMCKYSFSLFDDPEIDKLCLENTKYLYLEFPFDKALTPEDIRLVNSFVAKGKYKVIIANVEKLLFKTKFDIVEKLMKGNVLGLVSARCLEDKGLRDVVIELFEKNYAHILGTNLDPRAKNICSIKKCESIIAKKLSKAALERILENNENVLKDYPVRDIRVNWGIV